MITRVFTLEIVCEGEMFHTQNGKYEPTVEISRILDGMQSQILSGPLNREIHDSKGNLIGYTMIHEI